ncbi:BMC domain-containing protein [bacterium]|nr:BMC domain-containing protein [bacterium]
MKVYPAIALIEYSDIPMGILCSDAMVKHSPISMIKTGTVSRGKFLILIGGSVASVEEAYEEGVNRGKSFLLDSLFLPDVHRQVYDALLGNRTGCIGDGIAVFETKTVATVIRSSDAAVKSADVDIIETRMADSLGGQAFTIFTGKVGDLESAIRIAQRSAEEFNALCSYSIIPKLHPEIAKQIDVSTRFSKIESLFIKDGEINNVIGKGDRNSDT